VADPLDALTVRWWVDPAEGGGWVLVACGRPVAVLGNRHVAEHVAALHNDWLGRQR
jgi:hypothetical protein